MTQHDYEEILTPDTAARAGADSKMGETLTYLQTTKMNSMPMHNPDNDPLNE